MKRFSMMTAVAALAVVLFAATPASADTLQIQITGVNLTYSSTAVSNVTGLTGLLCDAGSCNGLFGDPAQSDPLLDAKFLVNGVLVGTLAANVFVDLQIPVGLLPNVGTVSGTDYGWFDLLTQNAVPGWGVAIDLVGWSITTNGIGGFTLAVNGFAVGGVGSQDLPFGLQIGDPIIISFSSNNLSGVTTSNGNILSFNSSGTGELTGEATRVPEPGTLALFGLGLAVLAGLRKKLQLNG